MRKTALSGALLAVSSFLVACGGVQPEPTHTQPEGPRGEPGTEVRSSKERITSAAPASDLAAAVRGNTDFALALHRELASSDTFRGDNLFISPQSISLALSLAYAGGVGDTAAAFEATMRQTLPAASYHRAMNDLDRQLMSRGQGARASDGTPFRLTINNQLFADQHFVMKAPYLDTLAQEYGAAVRQMDFRGAPEPSRVGINDWVADKTEDRIKDLLAQGSINEGTRAVLVNTIYFNASWKHRFDVTFTSPGDFHALDGSTVRTEMMRGSGGGVQAAQVSGVEVVSLPYDGDEMSMVLLMPPSDFAGFEASLTTDRLDDYLGALQGEEVSLSMPKFEHRSKAELSEALGALGLGLAFSERADFSAMSDESINITGVVHQSFVKVSEGGTEAAAATAITAGTTSISQPRVVEFNKPFLYLVRDDATGAVVFLGRYVKP